VQTIEKGVVVNVLKEGKGKRRKEAGKKGNERWTVRARGRGGKDIERGEAALRVERSIRKPR